jgi:glyoxylase-like metal-dependent hydrolase (beta-lactamase superfamily II)
VLIAGFPAAAFDTNCYVVAPAAGEQCVVVDPGVEVLAQLDEVLERHRLRPVAVLLTHGHIDHTFSVTPVCGARDVPAYIHPGDEDLLADPMKGLSAQTRSLFGGRLDWTEPTDVRPLVDGGTLALAGLQITVDHAPGHTPGSVAFRLPGSPDGEGAGPGDPAAQGDTDAQVMLAGDLLFAGSVGRTDLPGGDHATMLRSLATKVLTLPDHVVVLPGHGPRTTIGRERASNPFLQGLSGGTPSPVAPGRGI